MKKETKVSSPTYSCFPTEIEGFDALAELALDMRWSWNHSADEVWKRLDPVLWEATTNPWLILQTVSRDQLLRSLADPEFRKRVDEILQEKHREGESPAWFQTDHPQAPLSSAAYFSMEFMLSEALPIYSGGLGNVAGDQLKTASDLGMPIAGVGLLYQQGYFRQMIDREGAQQPLFPYNDPGQLPVTPLREPNGEWLRLELPLPGYPLWLRAWQVQVGSVKLYLLDSNDPVNSPGRRGVTGELYGGGQELRLVQELTLGIAGWQLLAALGIKPEVCHLNEGHAAFAVLERARDFMDQTGKPFEVALAVTRAGNLFTTHTPVAAGFDRFPPSLIEQYLGKYARDKLGISLRDLLALGRENPNDGSESFNMAYLALRGSGAVNGVSRLHGRVSRHIFQSLFPRWPEEEVPIGHVTNGVHMPSWNSGESEALWTGACGTDPWLGTLESLEQNMRNVSGSSLWKSRSSARESLVQYVRERFSHQLEAAGASPEVCEEANHVFDPSTLTLGFARRFATYKRPTLLLHDPARLLHILTNPQRPVQLVIAGKAHPADYPGQAMIREWTHFIRTSGARKNVVFLSDYDMVLTGRLVQGVDVWINTPRRPWEASGTSGMKVLVNGGMNLSELDGWWAEAYTPEVGWAIGDGKEHGDDPAWDAAEAEELYTLLEREIIPEFYARGTDGIPARWITRMRESMARLTPLFSANRTVREYTEKYYIPAARTYLERASDKGATGEKLMSWKRTLEGNWSDLRFGKLNVTSDGEKHVFEVEVYFGGLDPNSVRVELYANGAGDGEPICQEMIREKQLAGTNGFIYSARAPSSRPASDYTARAVPHFPGAAVPLEAAQILWQR
ncbi:MAG TPA: alpha-glucan family phosphorylase [Syntrophorhabdales bacterium]|nr:alpha-glucan family phosphorylase [Syntrophorhabdales bacterium]